MPGQRRTFQGSLVGSRDDTTLISLPLMEKVSSPVTCRLIGWMYAGQNASAWAEQGPGGWRRRTRRCTARAATSLPEGP